MTGGCLRKHGICLSATRQDCCRAVYLRLSLGPFTQLSWFKTYCFCTSIHTGMLLLTERAQHAWE